LSLIGGKWHSQLKTSDTRCNLLSLTCIPQYSLGSQGNTIQQSQQIDHYVTKSLKKLLKNFIYIWRLLGMKMKQPLTLPQCIFGDVNEATPDSARPNRHPSSRTDVSSMRTVEPDSTSNFFVWFLFCKQGYECLEFADNAIVDGAYTYNTIIVAIYFEVHNQFHIVKIQIAELLWQNCCGIFSYDL